MVDTIDPTTGEPVVLADPGQVQDSADALNNLYHPVAVQIAADNTAVSNSSTVVNDALQKTSEVTKYAAAGLLTVTSATRNFAAGLDTGRLTTFSDQIKAIGEAAQRPGVALGELQKIGSSLMGVLSRVGGVSGEQGANIQGLFRIIMEGGKDVGAAVRELVKYAENAVALGDELTVVRQATLAQAAASGSLDAVLTQAGAHMENFNKIASNQQAMWRDMGKALGLLPGDVAKYAGELNKIPGVLDNLVAGHAKARAQTEIFRGSLALMKISGRDYESINKDMMEAVLGFGTSQKGALDYTTRMSVAANALKIPVDELHKALTASSGAFKAFVTSEAAGNEMTKNLEASLGGYIQMLKNVGVPTSVATDMASEFAGAIGQMTIAQKAFISGQTGGPGGLMGAFQLDKLMDEGKIDQVMGKVQDVLRKQFGRIVTTAQAAQSQSAAEQMTRQVMILRQGPLGQFAKSDAEARRLLDAMSKGSPADMKKMVGDLQQEKPLDVFLNRGNLIAQGSQGILNDILGALSGAEYSTAAGVARVTQAGLGARPFSRMRPGETGGETPDVMEERRRTARQGAAGEGGRTLLESTMRDLKNLPASLAGTVRALGNAMATGDERTVAALDAKLKTQVEEYRRQAASLPTGRREEVMRNATALTGATTRANNQFFGGLPPGVTPPGGPARNADDESQIAALARSRGISMQDAITLYRAGVGQQGGATGGAGTTTRPGPLTQEQMTSRINDYMRTHPGTTRAEANAQLSSTLRDNTAPGARGTTPPGGGGALGQPTLVTLAPGTTFNMNVTSTCTNCGAKITTPEVAKVTSPAGVSTTR